jgi:hypothetical protein
MAKYGFSSILLSRKQYRPLAMNTLDKHRRKIPDGNSVIV